MNPKLPLNGHMYTLTVGRVLNTIVFQINLGKFLFRATLRVRLGSCLSTVLKMDNLDCTKINLCTFYSLSTGGAHSRLLAHIASPTSPPYVGKQLSSVPHTATVEMSCLQHCSTNVKLCILVKAQPCAPSTWPLSPTRLGIRPRDLGLSNEYTLGHCGLFAASRHKLASTSRH